MKAIPVAAAAVATGNDLVWRMVIGEDLER